ncbi:MAG: hypothetical protein HQL69_18885, partial [Magnetococcales bacterium]|nr:hypothetical protein [Magnetococcales bacterium]
KWPNFLNTLAVRVDDSIKAELSSGLQLIMDGTALDKVNNLIAKNMSALGPTNISPLFTELNFNECSQQGYPLFFQCQTSDRMGWQEVYISRDSKENNNRQKDPNFVGKWERDILTTAENLDGWLKEHKEERSRLSGYSKPRQRAIILDIKAKSLEYNLYLPQRAETKEDTTDYLNKRSSAGNVEEPSENIAKSGFYGNLLLGVDTEKIQNSESCFLLSLIRRAEFTYDTLESIYANPRKKLSVIMKETDGTQCSNWDINGKKYRFIRKETSNKLSNSDFSYRREYNNDSYYWIPLRFIP